MTESTHQHLLAALISAHQQSPLYAIVDTAKDADIHFKLDVLGATYYPIYQGEEREALETVAPYLVQLSVEDEFTQWYCEAVYGNQASVIVSSHDSIETLQAHCYQFAKPEMEFETDGEISNQAVFLAFYDPRVFPDYLRSVSLDYRIAFLSPLNAVFYEDGKGHLIQLTPNEARDQANYRVHSHDQPPSFDDIEASYPERLEVTDALHDYQPRLDMKTQQRLLDSGFARFTDELHQTLSETYPVLGDEDNISEAKRYLHEHAKAVRNAGFSNQAAITYYLRAQLDYGVGFSRDPQYTTLTEILRTPNIDSLSQADILYDAFDLFEQTVYGVDDQWRLACFAQITKASSTQPSQALRDLLNKDTVTALLSHLFPAKYAYLAQHNTKAIPQLINAANVYTQDVLSMQQVNARHSIAAVMFLFGYEFYQDFRLKKLNQCLQTLLEKQQPLDETALINLLQAGIADHG